MYQLALIVKNADPSIHGFHLLVAPVPPPPRPFPDLPFYDSQLFDLPSAPLSPSNNAPLPDDSPSSRSIVHDVHNSLQTLGLTGFDVSVAVNRLKTQLYPTWELLQPWKYWKLVEEPDYGPGPPLHTLIFMTEMQPDGNLLSGAAQWLSTQDAWKLLVGTDVGGTRIGPLATYAFSPHFPEGLLYKFNLKVQGQEYPPGVLVVPMNSFTLRPFQKTNLVIFASTDLSETDSKNALAVARADALIMDPGCHATEAQGQLSRIIRSLPEKLLIFLTHHHLDHTEGLPTVQKQNPQAVIVAHEATIHRMGKVAGTLKCIPVVDGSILLVSGQELRVVAAPGHTDGHMALLHLPTHTLIVGDHCLGQGSSRLDSDSGGNMQDYLATTQRFLDLAPRVIVPMHGHFNLWPAHMLCGYIRHREAREAKVLKSIERGAQTAFEIVSQAYSDTPPAMWMAALSNVKLHVDHLDYLQKLPVEFSMDSFNGSCGVAFHLHCLPRTIGHSLFKIVGSDKSYFHFIGKLSLALLIGSASYAWIRRRTSS